MVATYVGWSTADAAGTTIAVTAAAAAAAKASRPARPIPLTIPVLLSGSDAAVVPRPVDADLVHGGVDWRRVVVEVERPGGEPVLVFVVVDQEPRRPRRRRRTGR